MARSRDEMSRGPALRAGLRTVPAVVTVLLAASLSGCSDSGGVQEDFDPSASASPYVPVADVQQLMAHVVEPAAETYWDAVGWIVDFSGTTYIRPQTVEEWEAVRNAAYTVAESGNLLIMDARSEGREAWIGMAQAMIQAAERAIEAAEAQDEQGVFDRGAELYYTCTNCHGQYAVETLRPNVIRE